MMSFRLVTSRSEFFRQLDIAIDETKRLQGKSPGSMLEPFARQLDAMKQWSQQGRKPTFDERKSINMGRIAQREIQGTPDMEWYDYMVLITELAVYFKYWRTDPGLLTLDRTDWRTNFPDSYDVSDE